MKKQKFSVTLKMVLSAAAMIGIGTILGIVGYFLTTKPGEVRAPIAGLTLKNKEKDAAEAVLKNYLEELKVKDKKELAQYFSDDAKGVIGNLAGYYDNKNVSLDSFEILKVEKTGNKEFSFTAREFQKDVKYGIVGYYDNKYELIKPEDKYLLSSIKMGEYVDTSETKDWKVVNDLEKGYEMKYPENFFYQIPEISISTMAGASSLEGCYTRNFRGFVVRKVKVGQNTYCLSESTEGSAGSTYIDSSYTNIEKNRIATLHFIVRYPDCGALGIAADPAYKNCEENNKKGPQIVERVVSTFKFIEKK